MSGCPNSTGTWDPSEPDLARVTIVICTVLCMLTLAVATVVLVEKRHAKIGRAGSPNLLFVAILGCFLSYSEMVLYIIPPTGALCITQMWLRHEGFTLSVLSLIMRQHRIYSILYHRSLKNLLLREQNSCQAMSVLIAFGAVLLIVRTIFIKEIPLINASGYVVGCTLNAGTYIHIVGELALGVLLLYLCIRTRQVPSPYNDCYMCGLVGYNIIIGISIDTIYRGIGAEDVWQYSLLVSGFFRVHSLASVVLVGVIGGRVHMVLFPKREFFTTISTVSSLDNAHKLHLVMDNNGDVKTVTCYPCGPMIVTKENDVTAHVNEVPRSGGKQNQCAGYTEAEIDRLVSLYNAQKQEIKLLHQILETSPNEDVRGSNYTRAGQRGLVQCVECQTMGNAHHGLCPSCLRLRVGCYPPRQTYPPLPGECGLRGRLSGSWISLCDTASTVETNLAIGNVGCSLDDLSLPNDSDGDCTYNVSNA